MFEDELLNNVMGRFCVEYDEDTYQKISSIFVEEHLKLLNEYKNSINSQIERVSKILNSLGKI